MVAVVEILATDAVIAGLALKESAKTTSASRSLTTVVEVILAMLVATGDLVAKVQSAKTTSAWMTRPQPLLQHRQAAPRLHQALLQQPQAIQVAEQLLGSRAASGLALKVENVKTVAV